MPIDVFDLGDTVKCDFCGDDYTHSDLKGGFLFQSKAVCPVWAPESLKSIRKYHEEQFIKPYCPEDMTFRAWVLNVLRAGDNRVIIKTGKDFEWPTK